MAAACQVNWMPYVVGPMAMRPGLYYVGEVLGDAPAKLIRFVFSKLDTALIELTNKTMRVWTNEVLVTRGPVGTTIGDPFFSGGGGSWTTSGTTSGAVATVSGGCTLTCLPIGGLAQVQQTIAIATSDFGKEHAIRIVVSQGPVVFRVGSSVGASDLIAQTTLDTGTHSLAFRPSNSSATIQIESTDSWSKTLTLCQIESAGVMALPTPWAASDLANIRYDQSGDVIFVACYGQQQYKIERRGAHSWSTVLFYANDEPFQSSPGIQANFTPGDYRGNTTLTSDRPWFQQGHVGCLFRLFSNGQFNKTVLGNNNVFTPAVRVTGVGSTRNYTWTSTNNAGNKETFQRSFDSATTGFIDVSNHSDNSGFSSSTGGTGGSPDLDNVIAWERVGIKGGDYTAGGTATLISSYSGGGGYGICRVIAPFISSTQVNIEVLEPFSTLQATTDGSRGSGQPSTAFRPRCASMRAGCAGSAETRHGFPLRTISPATPTSIWTALRRETAAPSTSPWALAQSTRFRGDSPSLV